MPGLKFTNFATSTIADVGGIAAGDLSLDVAAGAGALFPALSAGDYFYAVLVASGGTREIIKVTARNVDTLTIVRAQDGTSASAFAQNDVVELRATAAVMEELYNKFTGRSIIPSVIARSKIAYNGGATAYTVTAAPARYLVKDKMAWWDATLTLAAIAGPVASTRYYLYLDYSAITSGTEITATELIWSSTAPTYNTTYNGWMNGDDLCIFAVATNTGPTNIYEFFHDGGDYVQYADALTGMIGAETPSNTWTDVDLSDFVPAFSSRAMLQVIATYADTNTTAKLRKNGQTGTTGQEIGVVSTTITHVYKTLQVYTDTSQVIEMKWVGATASNGIYIEVVGWFLPVGM